MTAILDTPLFDYQPPVRPSRPRKTRTTASTSAPPLAAEPACRGRWDLIDSPCGENVTKALELCARCPVLDQCRAWAESEPEFSGVAGGQVFVAHAPGGRP